MNDIDILKSLPKGSKKKGDKYILPSGKTAIFHKNKELDRMEEAILREKQVKKWNRGWKVKLIEKENPNWDDLYGRII